MGKTRLTKDVTRETNRVTNRKGMIMNVTLKAGDMLSFKAKGSRTEYEVPLSTCLNMALIFKAEDEFKAKMETYKAKKAMGQRARRPSRPGRVFSPIFYKALKFQ